MKMHGQDRFVFALEQVMLSHNFGHLKASLLNVMGTVSPEVRHDLATLDRESIRNAKRKKELTEQPRTAHRKKITTTSSRASGAYDAGDGD